MGSKLSAQTVPEVEQYMALIVKLAAVYYRAIPPTYQQWIDFDDVVQEGVVHFCAISCKYNSARKTKFMTFIFTALENNYRSYLGRFKTQMRDGCTVDISDLPLCAPSDSRLEMVAVEKRVNRVLELASPQLLSYLKFCVFGCTRADKHGSYVVAGDDLVLEMRRVCRSAGATINDFRTVMNLASIR